MCQNNKTFMSNMFIWMIYCNAFGDMKGHQGTLVYILLNRSLVVLSIILICCTLVVKEFIIQNMYSYTCKLFVIPRARYTYIKVAAQNVAWWGYVSVSAICLKLMSNLRRLQLIRLSLSWEHHSSDPDMQFLPVQHPVNPSIPHNLLNPVPSSKQWSGPAWTTETPC